MVQWLQQLTLKKTKIYKKEVKEQAWFGKKVMLSKNSWVFYLVGLFVAAQPWPLIKKKKIYMLYKEMLFVPCWLMLEFLLSYWFGIFAKRVSSLAFSGAYSIKKEVINLVKKQKIVFKLLKKHFSKILFLLKMQFESIETHQISHQIGTHQTWLWRFERFTFTWKSFIQSCSHVHHW